LPEINGGRLVAKQLKQAGIDTAFGVVAGPMIEVMSGMEREGIKVVNCRHEESACFAASAWGYIKKKPGVVIAGSGPGMINTITGLHVATESCMPLVVMGGSVDGRTRGIGGFLAVTIDPDSSAGPLSCAPIPRQPFREFSR
jgi:thiamine pyrophosphate-dependent acetolactate synthase large subunit-like protein